MQEPAAPGWLRDEFPLQSGAASAASSAVRGLSSTREVLGRGSWSTPKFLEQLASSRDVGLEGGTVCE